MGALITPGGIIGGRVGASGSASPPTISYVTPQSWTYGAAITPVSPTTTGATSFAVQSGALPTGVTVHPTTGVISGTPTQAKVAANVTIRATGPGGTADAVVNVAVPSPLYTSLVEYWSGDEASGVGVGAHAAIDLTDNNTVTADATGGPDGGQVRVFTAANTEFLSSASGSLVVGAGDAYWAGWVYLTTNTGNPMFFGKYGSGGNLGFIVWYWSGNGFRVDGSDDGTVGVDATDLTARAAGAWYFVEAKYTRSTKKVGVAVNGGAFAESPALATAGICASTREFSIGRNDAGLGYLNGRAGRLGMWQRLPTAAERTWLYNAGAGRLYAALATYDGG